MEIQQKIQQYLNGTYTKQEAEKVLQDLEHRETRDIFNECADEIWEESALCPTSDKEQQQYKKEALTLLRIFPLKKNPKIGYRVASIIGIAASILLVLMGGIKYINSMQQLDMEYATDTTGIGAHKEIKLPDGTIVVLNACSSLRYPNEFIGENRKVELSGEAFFRVKHNETSPFIVKTPIFDVKVLGTQFNVKAYREDELACVDVESGKVQVDLPDAMMQLTKKEQILINTESKEYRKENDVEEVAVWRKGYLRFNRTPIKDVVYELERMYNCHIRFDHEENFTNLITGVHENKSLEDVLKGIEYISGIKYRKSGNEIILYKTKR